MFAADGWAACRIAYTETSIAVGRAGALEGADSLDEDWPQFQVVEVDQSLAAAAVELGVAEGLRTLDALHLAAALRLGPAVTFATWDGALHAAAARRGLDVLPAVLDAG